MKTIENRLEGSGASRLLQMFDGQAGGGLEMTVATVTNTSPVAIKISGDPFDISGDSLIVAEDLLAHKRIAKISGGSVIGSTVSGGSVTSLTWQDAVIDYSAKISTGDKVIVVIAQDGQLYYVLDKAV